MPSGSRVQWVVMLLVLVAAAAGLTAWLLFHGNGEADSLAQGNGRIEATEVNLATKMAGRLQEVLVEEGDFFDKGQVLARMDVRTLEAGLREAEAALSQAEHGKTAAELAVEQQQTAIAAAQALVDQCQSQLELSTKELVRSQELMDQGAISRNDLDIAETTVRVNTAQLTEARAQLAAAQSALSTTQVAVLNAGDAIAQAQAQVETIRSEIDDATLTAPISGRVLYRLAEPGEVLAAGGPVLTLLDIGNVYMTIFLPTDQAGRVSMGAEARIVLDAWSAYSIPARVSFVSPQAQFTPRSVETESEREKLMFRVKVSIDPDLLRAHAEQVKTGLPGVAYIRLAPDAPWPEGLPPLVGQSSAP